MQKDLTIRILASKYGDHCVCAQLDGTWHGRTFEGWQSLALHHALYDDESLSRYVAEDPRIARLTPALGRHVASEITTRIMAMREK